MKVDVERKLEEEGMGLEEIIEYQENCNHEIRDVYRENTLGPLSGRSGEVEYCLVCGKELGFRGIIS